MLRSTLAIGAKTRSAPARSIRNDSSLFELSVQFKVAPARFSGSAITANAVDSGKRRRRWAPDGIEKLIKILPFAITAA
jgi:hypothetical protein